MGILSYERNLEIAGGCKFVLPIFGVHSNFIDLLSGDPWLPGPQRLLLDGK